jgi:hypothetical protein
MTMIDAPSLFRATVHRTNIGFVFSAKGADSSQPGATAPGLDLLVGGVADRQRGYGTFSVSPSQLSAVVKYVESQEEHHRTHSFQDEYRVLLGKYGVEFDERYVWD